MKLISNCLFLSLVTFIHSHTSVYGSDGYLFVTFKGENIADGEQIYFAISEGGENWESLNGEQPILTSSVGELGVRDPFLIRSSNEDKFHLIATDLSIYNNPNWTRAVREGSKSIVVWDSNDLIHWSEPRLIPVANSDAGCTWAPEAIYDDARGDYLVFWASTNGSDDFSKHRIWAARTADFKAFGEPFIFIEKPVGVIDTTIVNTNGRYFRFSKDETYKAITMESASDLMGPWSDQPQFSLAKATGYEGPLCFLLNAKGDEPAWCLLLDQYSKGTGYQPFTSGDLQTGAFTQAERFHFPFRFRHGSVLPISDLEMQRLKQAFGESE